MFLEAFAGPPRLVVGGGGPVAEALATIGGVVGLAVRAEPPGSAGFEEATRGLGPADAVVFVDHDDPALVPALIGVLGGRAGYVGVMGSRRHTPGFVSRLRQTGLDLTALHSPTGLDLGARRPPEIALSILAEVMAVTHQRPGAASTSWEGQRKAPSRPRARGPRFSSGPSIPRTAPPSPTHLGGWAGSRPSHGKRPGRTARRGRQTYRSTAR